MNVKLLRKIQKHILEEPRRFFMEDYCLVAPVGEALDLDDVVRTMPSCGTAGCIAGWAVMLGNGKRPRSWEDFDFFREGCKLLGFNVTSEDEYWDSEEGNRLFLTRYWPAPFRNRYHEAETTKAKAQIACKRIDHFIATKGAE